MLGNIRIVLVNTFHPGNIGSSLRAMKTMGLTELSLVSPQRYPDKAVDVMAAGASDLINNIRIVNTLEQAIADCSLVIGTSARIRGESWPILNAKTCAQKVAKESNKGKAALVFGREKTGLTNDELQLCNYHVMINTHPNYPVLNLAQAVQIICYDVWNEISSTKKNDLKEDSIYPTNKAMMQFYEALEEILYEINFIVKQHPGDIMVKLRRIFNRSRLEIHELNILRGILARIHQNASATDLDTKK